MIRLKLFGSVALEDREGRSVQSVLQQPKRFALLAYIALEGRGRPVRRETLRGIFWPEVPEAQARHALNQSIHYLRRSLGHQALTSDSMEDIGVAPGAVACDAVQFSELLARGELREALAHYDGELLPGCYVPDTPEFERWLEEQRDALRRQAADAAWRLAESQATLEPGPAGGTAAAAWGRRAVELAGGDELAVRRLIQLLGRLGDPAGAREAYAALHRRLAADHGAEPSVATRRLLDEVCGAEADWRAAVDGYAAALPAGSAPEGDPDSGPESKPDGGRQPGRGDGAGTGGRRRGRLASAALALAFLLAVGGVFWLLARSAGEPVPEGVATVLIESISSYTAEGEDGGDGALLDGVVALLQGSGDMVVLGGVPPERARRGVGGDAPRHAYRFRGGVLRQGDSVRVSGVLSEREGLTLASTIVHLRAAPGLAASTEVAATLAAFIRHEVGRDMQRRAAADGNVDPAAQKLVDRAVRFRARGDSLRRRGAVEAALAAYQDADSLLAAAGRHAPRWREPPVQRGETAERRMWAHMLPPAGNRRAWRNALADGLAEVVPASRHFAGDPALAEIRGVLRFWLWQTAPPDSLAAARALLPLLEEDLRLAVAQRPGHSRPWNYLSSVLAARGSFGEAYWAADRALRAEVYVESVPGHAVRLFSTALEAGDVAAAREWCGEIGRRHADEVVWPLCRLMLLATRSAPAPAELAEADSIFRDAQHAHAASGASGQLEALVGVVLARGGARDSARALVDRAAAAAARDSELLPQVAWGRLHLGETDEAARLLREYLDGNPLSRAGIVLSRRFAPLHGHPLLAEPLGSGLEGSNMRE
jgi:DNA-binding SARP family transcriptional activator